MGPSQPPPGLMNLGNTCFLNSCLQILFQTEKLNSLLDNPSTFSRLTPDSKILVEWNHLRNEMRTTQTVNPIKFVSTVQTVATQKNRHLFSGWNQNDVQEFLIFLFECFHDSLKREVEMNIKGTPTTEKDRLAVKCYTTIINMYKNTYSEFIDIFFGIHVSEIYDVAESYSTVPEPFFVLSLPIVGKSLLECLDAYLMPEELGAAYTTEAGNVTYTAKKRIRIWSLPSVLIIDFKRFTGFTRKNRTQIDFPVKGLDLRKYVEGYNSESCIYDLYGVANHMGTLEGGHYTAFVKTVDDNWYLCNDTEVNGPLNYVEGFLAQNAYCLFYKKRGSSG